MKPCHAEGERGNFLELVISHIISIDEEGTIDGTISSPDVLGRGVTATGTAGVTIVNIAGSRERETERHRKREK